MVYFHKIKSWNLRNLCPVNMPMVIQPLVRRWANVLMSACPNIGPTLANSKNSISVIIQLPKIWLACQLLTNIGPMLEWCWHYVPNIGPMLGQVDIGTLAQRRTNGWQMVGPTLAHCRPNIGMFMGCILVEHAPGVGHTATELVPASGDECYLLIFSWAVSPHVPAPPPPPPPPPLPGIQLTGA